MDLIDSAKASDTEIPGIETTPDLIDIPVHRYPILEPEQHAILITDVENEITDSCSLARTA